MPDKPKKRELPSLRGRLIVLYVSALLIAILLSAGIFIMLIVNVLGSSTRSDLNFTLQETSGNMATKMTLVADMLQSIRKNDTLADALANGSLALEGEEQAEIATALTKAVDLYSDKNSGGLSLPFVEMVYLFDQNGALCRSTYHEYLAARQAEIDSGYRAQYEAFRASGTDVQTVTTAGAVNILYTLYDNWMDPTGTVIFVLNESAIQELLQKIAEYPGAYWGVFDKTGAPVLQSEAGRLTQEEEAYLSAVRSADTFQYSIKGVPFLVYTQFHSMGLRTVLGIPANQLAILLYRAVFPYLGLSILLSIGISAVLFLIILRLTRPLPEVAHKLQQVAEQHFDVKLPAYPSAEFNTISTTFNTMTDTINHLINDVYEKKLLAMDSEIRLLQSQINPHFMYNVLCSIAMKAKLDGNEDVYKMASSFAGLTQARLNRSGQDKIPLEQELQYVRFYLDLQHFRFEDKLHYHIDVQDPALLQYTIPRLTMEIIVENAVVHGIEPKAGPGTVYVDISETQDGILILVEDDGVGFRQQDGYVSLPLPPKEDDEGTHNYVALNNAYKLLHHYYGSGYGISIQSRKDTGTIVKIKIPKERSTQHDEHYDRG